jgi:hypothetical protein
MQKAEHFSPDPLDRVASFDAYLASSLQRSLEIEWRLSQLEAKLPDPSLIFPVRELLNSKSKLMRRLQNRHELPAEEIEQIRAALRATRTNVLQLVRKTMQSMNDPENIIQQEIKLISQL